MRGAEIHRSAGSVGADAHVASPLRVRMPLFEIVLDFFREFQLLGRNYLGQGLAGFGVDLLAPAGKFLQRMGELLILGRRLPSEGF